MTQKGKKEIQYKNIKRVAANPEVLTKNNQRVDEVLRIFARMISKAILKEREEERLKESEKAKGSIPISKSLTIVSGALFVCNVLITRCPVVDASIPILAVS